MLYSRPLILLHPQMQVDVNVPLRAPGVVLRDDYMHPQAISTYHLARRTGISSVQLRRVLQGHSLYAEDALRLAITFRTSALYWLVLQARHELECLRNASAAELSVP